MRPFQVAHIHPAQFHQSLGRPVPVPRPRHHLDLPSPSPIPRHHEPRLLLGLGLGLGHHLFGRFGLVPFDPRPALRLLPLGRQANFRRRQVQRRIGVEPADEVQPSSLPGTKARQVVAGEARVGREEESFRWGNQRRSTNSISVRTSAGVRWRPLPSRSSFLLRQRTTSKGKSARSDSSRESEPARPGPATCVPSGRR